MGTIRSKEAVLGILEMYPRDLARSLEGIRGFEGGLSGMYPVVVAATENKFGQEGSAGIAEMLSEGLGFGRGYLSPLDLVNGLKESRQSVGDYAEGLSTAWNRERRGFYLSPTDLEKVLAISVEHIKTIGVRDRLLSGQVVVEIDDKADVHSFRDGISNRILDELGYGMGFPAWPWALMSPLELYYRFSHLEGNPKYEVWAKFVDWCREKSGIRNLEIQKC